MAGEPLAAYEPNDIFLRSVSSEDFHPPLVVAEPVNHPGWVLPAVAVPLGVEDLPRSAQFFVGVRRVTFRQQKGKEHCLYLHCFKTLEEARQIIGEFITHYNTEWLIGAISWYPPK